MGSRRGHRHRRLQPAEQRAQVFVLVGLPIEVWDLIVGWCDIDDMRALTRTCAALRRCAWARVDAACRATHASVDAFVTLWERETSRGDRLLDALSCSLCGPRRDAYDYSNDSDDSDGNDPESKSIAAPPIKWRAYTTLSPYERVYTTWLCDACGRRARERIEQGDSIDDSDGANRDPQGDPNGVQTFAMAQEIDVDRPHVWSTHGRLADADLVYADHVDDVNFVVPACVAHLLDARPFAWLAAHGVGKPEARDRGDILARIGSIRGWMPLRRRACVWTGQPGCTRRSVLMVCCDAANPMWGAVAVAHLHHRRRIVSWYEAEPSLADLMARWREHPLRLFDALYATAWMEWAIATYVGAARHVDRQKARAHAVCDQHALDTIADDMHAASGRPWAGLLRPDEYRSFFDEHDAIDGILDDNDLLCSGAAPRRHRRCRRTKRRRPVRS